MSQTTTLMGHHKGIEKYTGADGDDVFQRKGKVPDGTHPLFEGDLCKGVQKDPQEDQRQISVHGQGLLRVPKVN